MKKLLILLAISIFSISVFSQTVTGVGSGWEQIRKKTNFKDTLNVVKHANFSGTVSFANSEDIGKIAILTSDTLNLFFNVGGGAAGDTALFRVSYIMASFDSFVNDTLVVDKLEVTLLGTSPDVDIQLYFDDNLNDATPTAVFTNSLTVTSVTTGNETSTITNGDIPPNKKCWFKLTEKTTQPTYLSGTLYCHRKNRSY